MPTFAFDDAKSIDDNLAAFFTHLEQYDQEFADHLRTHLPVAVGNDFDRTVFNVTVAKLLDADPPTQNDA